MSSPCRRIFAWHSTRFIMLLPALFACGGGGDPNEPGVPRSITVDPPSLSFTALGQTQQLSPTVTDGQGTPLPEVPVSWTTDDAAIATVTPDGLVTAEGSGSTRLTATAGPAIAEVQVDVVQTPSQIRKVAGDGQAGTPGQPVATPPEVVVEDANGNPVAGVPVTFTVISGGGSVTGGSTTTDGSGIARVGSWTLGSAGQNQLRATAAGSGISGNPVTFTAGSAFNIEVRFIGSATTSQREAFAEAEARWETLISGDLQDVLLTAEPADCGPESPAINEMVDDLLILVTVEEIDGRGGVLGSAGPCFVRIANILPVLGAMRFDTDDLADVEAIGLLSQVVLHEMGHVLGFGSLWETKGFLADPTLPEGSTSTDPYFIGFNAIAAFNDIGGSGYSGKKVPVENTGGEGTADSHWRESIFDAELMTGFINTGQNPVSRVTVASLRDLGFAVNEDAADDYTLTLTFARSITAPGVPLGNDVMRLPIRKVDAAGRVMSIIRR